MPRLTADTLLSPAGDEAPRAASPPPNLRMFTQRVLIPARHTLTLAWDPRCHFVTHREVGQEYESLLSIY